MTPDAAAFLAKAASLSAQGEAMLTIGLWDAAGRAAYLAGFHAARALIVARTGKVARTHHGVQTEFLRLTKDDAAVPADARVFLSRAYNLKAIADYETGPEATVSPERAAEALADCVTFIDLIRQVLYQG